MSGVHPDQPSLLEPLSAYSYTRSVLEDAEADRYDREVYRPGSYDS